MTSSDVVHVLGLDQEISIPAPNVLGQVELRRSRHPLLVLQVGVERGHGALEGEADILCAHREVLAAPFKLAFW